MSEKWMTNDTVRDVLQNIGFHRENDGMEAAHIIARANG